MSRRCELTAKGALVGHKVSHSNIKTKRRFLPNLLNVTLMSDSLGKSFKLRISANALKSVDHRGGLDAFLAKAQRHGPVAQGAGDQARSQEEAGRGGLSFPVTTRGSEGRPLVPDLCRISSSSLLPQHRELQQQRPLQRREIVVRDQRQHQRAGGRRDAPPCPSKLSIWWPMSAKISSGPSSTARGATRAQRHAADADAQARASRRTAAPGSAGRRAASARNR